MPVNKEGEEEDPGADEECVDDFPFFHRGIISDWRERHYLQLVMGKPWSARNLSCVLKLRKLPMGLGMSKKERYLFRLLFAGEYRIIVVKAGRAVFLRRRHGFK